MRKKIFALILVCCILLSSIASLCESIFVDAFAVDVVSEELGSETISESPDIFADDIVIDDAVIVDDSYGLSGNDVENCDASVQVESTEGNIVNEVLDESSDIDVISYDVFEDDIVVDEIETVDRIVGRFSDVISAVDYVELYGAQFSTIDNFIIGVPGQSFIDSCTDYITDLYGDVSMDYVCGFVPYYPDVDVNACNMTVYLACLDINDVNDFVVCGCSENGDWFVFDTVFYVEDNHVVFDVPAGFCAYFLYKDELGCNDGHTVFSDADSIDVGIILDDESESDGIHDTFSNDDVENGIADSNFIADNDNGDNNEDDNDEDVADVFEHDDLMEFFDGDDADDVDGDSISGDDGVNNGVDDEYAIDDLSEDELQTVVDEPVLSGDSDDIFDNGSDDFNDDIEDDTLGGVSSGNDGFNNGSADIGIKDDENIGDNDEFGGDLDLEESGVVDEDVDSVVSKMESDLESDVFLNGSLEYVGLDYRVVVFCPESAHVPVDAVLEVTELGKHTDEYGFYLDKANDYVEDFGSDMVSFARFFDITIFDGNGYVVEPDDTVSVQIVLDAVPDDVQVIHFDETSGETMQVSQVDASVESEDAFTVLKSQSGLSDFADDIELIEEGIDSAVNANETFVIEFAAESFSVYGVISSVIEKHILTHDGYDYKISVFYDSNAGVPEGSDLIVSEILEDSDVFYGYMTEAERVLEWPVGIPDYFRLFDIAIVDMNGDEVIIQAPVNVSISLSDAVDNVRVVHFSGEFDNIGSDEVGMVSGSVITDVSVVGNDINFVTDGFSAYAIADGPAPVDIGWTKLMTIDDLRTFGSEGVYMGHVNGYYFTDEPYTWSTNGARRTGVVKTTPPFSTPSIQSAVYYFEPVTGTTDSFYVYCVKDNVRYYLYNTGNNSLQLSSTNKTGFVFGSDDNGTFTAHSGQWYVNMQGGAPGKTFCCYNKADDVNNKLNLFYQEDVDEEPLGGLDGATYGLMYWNGDISGKALMAEQSGNNLLAKTLTVMSNFENHEDKLYVPYDSDISMWTFHWVDHDRYYLTSEVDGVQKYLSSGSGGFLFKDVADSSCVFQVQVGSGTHSGEMCLRGYGGVLSYSGDINTGFDLNGTVGSEWLYPVTYAELTSDYYMTYRATKVSVSDESITNGSKIIVYTRIWDDVDKKYRLYALDADGSLVPCYDEGGVIQWVGSRLNTMLWSFTEYYWEGTNDPNYYYELYNPYSEVFIAPQLTNGQVFQDGTIGINLPGRRNGYYYSPIIVWDEDSHTYVALGVNSNGTGVSAVSSLNSCDFYFAVLDENSSVDGLLTVETIDNAQYGITMKMVDFSSGKVMNNFLGSSVGGLGFPATKGLLSTNLGSDNYPIAASGSLGTLFNGVRDVNGLFLKNTYDGTGYFEFDSTQNFASLNNSTGLFKVYREIASYDSAGGRSTLQHGQFLPFNDIEAGVLCTVNSKNLYSVLAEELPESDPRKYEPLYLVNPVNCYFGMELEASFMEPPSGLDKWGHDIIFEFTGDDDFWLYVDGELIIDLGGIHSALAGSVNYSTGEVVVEGRQTTLRDLFYSNYIGRGLSASDAQALIDDKFEQNDNGQWVFKDYSTHVMRIFYMERGAGASNLKMKFNLASTSSGVVELNKTMDGIGDSNHVFAKFPYQIWYTMSAVEEGVVPTEYLLTDTTFDSSVLYKDSVKSVEYRDYIVTDGIRYDSVFMLSDGETASITFPENTVSYRIVECGVDDNVYESVAVNNVDITGVEHVGTSRKDFGIDYAGVNERQFVGYKNKVRDGVIGSVLLQKHLYKEDGITSLSHAEDNTMFNFRLYLSSEYDDVMIPADMHPYYMLNENGEYCVWNVSLDGYVSTGVSDFSQLTDDQRVAATFITSMNGSIAKVPAFYTVEVRDMIGGTKFKLVERENEVPDGYSFQKYVYDGVDSYMQSNGVSGVVDAGEDALAVVCNIRGWGIRVNKVWADRDYVTDRDTTYFAIFVNDGSSCYLVSDTVRAMEYGNDSLYWYFESLPYSGFTFSQYEVYEVIPVGGQLVVSSTGAVFGYDSLVIVDEGESISLDGVSKGLSVPTEFEYTVSYNRGNVGVDSNVRTDVVYNNRPGLSVYKTDWNWQPIAGSSFSFDYDSGAIGTFSSGSNGFVTNAFLGAGVIYTLTEIASPTGFMMLPDSLNIVMNEGVPFVSNLDSAYYDLSNHGDGWILKIRNKPYLFSVKKINGFTNEPLEGVHFELHKEKTVGNVTSFDLVPVVGFEDVVSDANGVLSGLDATLSSGVYQLLEKSPPVGYFVPSQPVVFVISDDGSVSLRGSFVNAVVDTVTHADFVEYTIQVKNYPLSSIVVGKTVTGEFGSRDKLFGFTVTFGGGFWDGSGASVRNTVTGQQYTVSNGRCVFRLRDGEFVEFSNIPIGVSYSVVENDANKDGYVTTYTDNASGVVGSELITVMVTNSVPVIVPTGVNIWYVGSICMMIIGFIICLFVCCKLFSLKC